MQRTIFRIKLIFLAIFVVATLGVWAYHGLYVWPRDKCEKGGGWFDPKSRQCGHVVYIPDITGRYLRNGREEKVDPANLAAARKRRQPPG
jgi:hypothetical protein